MWQREEKVHKYRTCFGWLFAHCILQLRTSNSNIIKTFELWSSSSSKPSFPSFLMTLDRPVQRLKRAIMKSIISYSLDCLLASSQTAANASLMMVTNMDNTIKKTTTMYSRNISVPKRLPCCRSYIIATTSYVHTTLIKCKPTHFTAHNDVTLQ